MAPALAMMPALAAVLVPPVALATWKWPLMALYIRPSLLLG
jgi:hypothetical protein